MTKSIQLFLLLVFPMLGHAQKIIHAEMLGRPEPNKISLHLVFDTLVEHSVQYRVQGTANFNKTPWTLCNSDKIMMLELNNLLPDNAYEYFVQYRLPGSDSVINRPTYRFHTQRAPTKPFIFTVQADPHLDEQSDTAIYSLCLKNQLEDQPDFMIDLGDIFMTDKLRRNGSKIVTKDTIQSRVHLMRSYYEKLTHSVPLFIALGNHEAEAGWNLIANPENMANWSTLERKKYFINPHPDGFYTGDSIQHAVVGIRENYYAWNWGNSLFIVLDPYWYTQQKPDSLSGWRWTLGKVQYDWLKRTLENSSAQFKFIFAHQLVGGDPDGRGGVEFADYYEWGGKNADGTDGFAQNRPGWYKPIKELLQENKVHIFFHGHDHFFAKQDKECLVYQETPQPSHPNFSNASQAAVYGYLEGKILPNSGHLRCSVSENGIKVEYVRTYLTINENGSRHNKDVSASYFIGKVNCYDSISTSVPVIWNSDYADEIAYPNPFSKETTISFSIQKAGDIQVRIYNLEGKIIRDLVPQQQLQKGTYQVIWDGKNHLNERQTEGQYVYVIESENQLIKTGKLILEFEH